MRLSPDRAVRVRVLAGDILLCSCERHFTLTVPLSTQVCKLISANLMLGNPAMDQHPSRREKNTPQSLLPTEAGHNRGAGEPLGSYANSTYLTFTSLCITMQTANVP